MRVKLKKIRKKQGNSIDIELLNDEVARKVVTEQIRDKVATAIIEKEAYQDVDATWNGIQSALVTVVKDNLARKRTKKKGVDE